ncbi:hypothetical protein SNEBB_007898 [Seison nebaliae]|nr:hypothetical protein SNEBB_007898 [Seison nebaliae]
MATTLANEIILDKGTLVDGVQIYGMTKEDLINVATDLNIHFSNGDSKKELIIEILEELNILFKNNELPQNIDHMKLAMARQSESIKMRVIQHIQNQKVEHDNEEVQTYKEGYKETNTPNNNNAPIIITNPIVPKREVDESLTSWLKRFELHLKSNRIPESLHFDTLMNALSEEERAIVNIEKHKGNKIISNFKDLSTLLIRETMIGQPIEEFYRIHRKTDESIAIYFSRLESMAEIAFATWSIKEKEDQLKSQLTQQTDGRSLSSIVISATQIEAEEKFICDNYRKSPNETLENKLQKMKEHIRELFDLLSWDEPGEKYLDLLQEIDYLMSQLNRAQED